MEEECCALAGSLVLLVSIFDAASAFCFLSFSMYRLSYLYVYLLSCVLRLSYLLKSEVYHKESMAQLSSLLYFN
jgi:hypothetical protein